VPVAVSDSERERNGDSLRRGRKRGRPDGERSGVPDRFGWPEFAAFDCERWNRNRRTSAYRNQRLHGRNLPLAVGQLSG
jgi:hypothetical protein